VLWYTSIIWLIFLGFIDMTSTLLVQRPEWQALQAHLEQIKTQQLRDWFAADAQRFERFSLRCGGLLFDYSKNRITAETLALLVRLAQASQLSAKIEALFSAEPLNLTEARPALHMALRDPQQTALWVNDKNVRLLVQAALAKMSYFVNALRQGEWRGATGKTIRDIVNIGIGGSHLGPLMSTHALAAVSDSPLRFHFIADVDERALQEVWTQLDPERTLFIVSSKSFTTLETVVNAKRCQQWLGEKLGQASLQPHFVAVTAQKARAEAFGIPEEQIFPIWDWVGGRYSIWSAIGLPLALQLGMDGFHAFLQGAAEADRHFREADLPHNIPVIMGMLGIWYANFFEAPTQAIIPYAYSLKYLRSYLQQLDMESNGKRITRAGGEANYATGPRIWGELGIHGQHAFHQLLHQGRHLVPVDFILVGRQGGQAFEAHQDLLIANALSQAQALMQGKEAAAFVQELCTQGLSVAQAETLAKHKEIPGNRPSSILFMDQLTPQNLGFLLACYEHKIFVQSVIWDVNPFDQWGVELGKALLPSVLEGLEHPAANTHQDASTQSLIAHYKALKQSL